MTREYVVDGVTLARFTKTEDAVEVFGPEPDQLQLEGAPVHRVATWRRGKGWSFDPSLEVGPWDVARVESFIGDGRP